MKKVFKVYVTLKTFLYTIRCLFFCFLCVLTSQDYLMLIDETGYYKVDRHLPPESAVFCKDIAQCATHGIKTDIGTCTKGGGE